MSSQDGTDNRAKKLYDIPTAAELAGFSSRHFRKIIGEDNIPVVQVGSKMFINKRDFDEWKSTRGEVRLDAALQQLDRWIREDAARTSILETVAADSDF